MDTSRTAYVVDAPNPASDIAGETAAALAAASMAFKSSDPGYSETLLRNAIKAFQYADNYRGAYSDNADVHNAVCPFYCDFGGYQVSTNSLLAFNHPFLDTYTFFFFHIVITWDCTSIIIPSEDIVLKLQFRGL